MKYLFALALYCSALILSSCQKTTPQADEVPSKEQITQAIHQDISVAEAKKLVANPAEGLAIIDIRTPQEFTDGHLKGAININFRSADFKAQLSKLDRDKIYLMHCKSGRRSKQSLAVWKELGFKTVYHVSDGYDAWVK